MAKPVNIKTENTDRRRSLKILLSVDFQKNINYVFEIYRQAVLLKLTGYVEKQPNGMIDILISGHFALIEQFVAWLKPFTGKSTGLSIEKRPTKIIYNEFRIIKKINTIKNEKN